MSWQAELSSQLQQVSWPDLPPGKAGVASVLIPMGRNLQSGRDEILLTKRTNFLMHHKGQVSFPGGFREPIDDDLLQTALRESWEEIGLKAADIEIIGRLPPTETLRNVFIYPWVGWMNFPYSFDPNPSEVDKIIFLPVERLVRDGFFPVENQNHPRETFLGIKTEGELVWGATARILDDLRQRLLSLQAFRDLS